MDMVTCLQCLHPTITRTHIASIPPHCAGHGGHDGLCDGIWPLPVGRQRGQLSDGATLLHR